MTGVVLVAAAAAASSLGLTWLSIRWLRRRALDVPGARSSHAAPTPRGAGIAVVPVIVAAWLLGGGGAGLPPWGPWALAAAAAALAALSFVDDVRGLPALPRLVAHGVAVAPGLVLLAGGPALTPLPTGVEVVGLGLAWVWFINAFNFMDGIDGLSAVEAVAVGVGAAAVALIAGPAGDAAVLGAAVAGGAAGFAVWNRPPARVFLGDAGSIPLGFLIGWLLLELARHGHALEALLLPGYYLADASITLGRRLWRRERPWTPHREHFYQHAVRAGWSHGQVVGLVAATNVLIVAGALVAALGAPWLGALLAATTVALSLWWL